MVGFPLLGQAVTTCQLVEMKSACSSVAAARSSSNRSFPLKPLPGESAGNSQISR
jgi:hypothetical protein